MPHFEIIFLSVAMFTTDFLISGISALNENIVVLTYEKEKFQEVKIHKITPFWFTGNLISGYRHVIMNFRL